MKGISDDNDPTLVSSFFSVGGIDLALRATGFTPEELTRTLVDRVRDDDPQVSLAGIRELRKHLKEALQIEGHLVKAAVEVRDENGNEGRISGHRFVGRRTSGQFSGTGSLHLPRESVEGGTADSDPDSGGSGESGGG